MTCKKICCCCVVNLHMNSTSNFKCYPFLCTERLFWDLCFGSWASARRGKKNFLPRHVIYVQVHVLLELTLFCFWDFGHKRTHFLYLFLISFSQKWIFSSHLVKDRETEQHILAHSLFFLQSVKDLVFTPWTIHLILCFSDVPFLIQVRFNQIQLVAWLYLVIQSNLIILGVSPPSRRYVTIFSY